MYLNINSWRSLIIFYFIDFQVVVLSWIYFFKAIHYRYNLFVVGTKERIADALLKAMDHPVYGDKFKKFGLTSFKEIDESFYDDVRDAIRQSNQEKLYPAYY